MESPEGTIPGDIERELAAHEEPPVSVEEQLQRDLEALTERVLEQVRGPVGQREWALCRTKMEEALHWAKAARGPFAN